MLVKVWLPDKTYKSYHSVSTTHLYISVQFSLHGKKKILSSKRGRKKKEKKRSGSEDQERTTQIPDLAGGANFFNLYTQQLKSQKTHYIWWVRQNQPFATWTLQVSLLPSCYVGRHLQVFVFVQRTIFQFLTQNRWKVINYQRQNAMSFL